MFRVDLSPCIQVRMLASHRTSGGAAQFPAAQPRPGRTETSPSGSVYAGRYGGGTIAAPECK